ncbi:MAG TPA: hypothetical protein VEQ11_20985 [Chloroflexota bacterium]|nr:hypothetical protein [Chloroflexota bacterium]
MSGDNQDIRVDMEALNAPTVDFFILADHAEAVNGKLYLMGGGWDRIFVSDFNKSVDIAFALGVLVPWNATNMRHTIQITIEDLDRKQPVPFNLSAGFVTGRPPSITEGETQRALLALSDVSVKFDEPGAYQAIARIVGGHERRVEFRLVALPTVQIQAPKG